MQIFIAIKFNFRVHKKALKYVMQEPSEFHQKFNLKYEQIILIQLLNCFAYIQVGIVKISIFCLRNNSKQKLTMQLVCALNFKFTLFENK